VHDIDLLVYNDFLLSIGDALAPFLLNFALEHPSKDGQENRVGLKLNGTHHLPAYADDVNLLGDNIVSFRLMLITN
jgi:hypothetical protein